MTTRLPAKCLSVDIIAIDVLSNRNPSDELGPGMPTSWNATLEVKPQFHSSIRTPRQLIYDARDITAGDYLAFGRPVKLYRVDSVASSTPSRAVITMSDLDSVAALHDTDQGGNAVPDSDAGICFATEDGEPVLFPLPNPLPSDLDFGGITEIISQFKFLQKAKYITVYQPGNSFQVDDMISLNSDGTYATTYSLGSPGQYPSVGYVADIDFPQPGYFRYRAAGPIIPFASTIGSPGQKLYLDPSNAGAVTATQPTGRNYPQLIKIDNTTAIWIGNSQVDGAVANFFVPSSAALNTLTDTKDGDFAYSDNLGNQWELYLKAGGQWKLISTEAAATTDAKTIKVYVDYTSDPVTVAHRLSPNSRIVNVAVRVTQRWDDPGATLTLGDDTVPDRFMPEDQNDLTTIDEYQSMPSYKYTGTVQPLIKVFLNNAAATRGAAEIIFTYV